MRSPGSRLPLITTNMMSAKNTIPKASKPIPAPKKWNTTISAKIVSSTVTKIAIAFPKACYVGSAGLPLHAFCRFLHSQHAFLPPLYRRRASVKLQSENHVVNIACSLERMQLLPWNGQEDRTEKSRRAMPGLHSMEDFHA